jgi:hypothetical protein
LSTAVALATDHEIVEIIRGKVEQITSAGELQIESAQIASVTVLPELYEKKGIEELRPQHIIYDRFISPFLFTIHPAGPCLNVPIALSAPAVSEPKNPLNWPKYYWITLPSGTRKALKG